MVEKVSLLPFEIMDKISKASTKKEKVELLKKYDSLALKNILKGTFDDAIVWILPDGNPPYTPASESSPPSTFYKQYDTLKYFVKGGPGERLISLKREKMFIQLIESVHPKDAELILLMIEKKSPAKGLTKAVVKEVFPNLISK